MTYKMTTKLLALLIAITGLSGCGSDITSSGTISRITYNRSHGSLWGVQFYIDLTKTEIAEARFFCQGETEQTEIYNIPIPAEVWEEVEQAISDLAPSLKEKKKKERLFQSKMQKLDGTEERTLTLTRETENGEKTISYDFPTSEEAAKLENLLEALAQGTADETNTEK